MLLQGFYLDRTSNLTKSGGFTVYMTAVFLVIAGLFVAMLFKGLFQQDKSAASQIDKSVAMMAAQSAMQFAERWIDRNEPGVGIKCSGFELEAKLTETIQVCNQLMDEESAKKVPWVNRYRLTSTLPDGREVTSEFHVAYLGFNNGSGSGVYQITAAGYGQRVDTVAVIQATYSNGLVSVNSLSNL